MKQDTFENIVSEQIKRCTNTLITKAKEYATDDRLHNFRTAAVMQDQTMAQALGGMMAKHTISVYDMIASGQCYDIAVWNEKITDHMNYLLLLSAVVREVQTTGVENIES